MGDGPRRLRMDRMEDLMLGDKKTIPLWRLKRPHFLSLERALESRRGDSQTTGMTSAEQSVVGLKAGHRRAIMTKHKGKANQSARITVCDPPPQIGR
jgi:hypothetical protein